MSLPCVVNKALPSPEITCGNANVTQLASQHGRQWSPYMDNGGTVMAVAGKDFVVIAGDTRMSSGYSIMSRKVSKLKQMTDRCVIGAAGMQADRGTLFNLLRARCVMYEQDHREHMSTPSFAKMLSATLYYRRFFPYYCFNLVAGLNDQGEGFVYSYDAIGSYEQQKYGVQGSGSSLGTSLLDNQVAFKTQPQNFRERSLEETITLVKDCMASICERDINTGDSVHLKIITADGIRDETFEIKKD